MEKVTGEVLDINNEYSSYQEYKTAVDNELQRSAESFVRIGHLLKVARDTDILKESGYGSVNEFAYAEYNLDKSQVSRFININDQFSEGGYSDRLMERYRDFGYAKLALMLLLPDVVKEELSADYSKAEIQEIKEEIDAEKKITDIEVMLEGQDRQQALMDSNICKVMHQIGHDHPELYIQLHACVSDDGWQARLKDILAPAGENMYSVRIQGIGKLMIFFRESKEEIPVTNIRTGEKEIYTWQQAYEALRGIMKPELLPEESWKEVYGEDFPIKEGPKKPEVAPVQPKERPRKQSRVIKADPNEKKKEEPQKEPQEEQQPEEQKQGEPEEELIEEKQPSSDPDYSQNSIEDYSGVMPDEAEKPALPDIPPLMQEMTDEKKRKYLLEALKKNTESIYDAASLNDYKNAEEFLDVVKEGLFELKDLWMQSTDKKEDGAG